MGASGTGPATKASTSAGLATATSARRLPLRAHTDGCPLPGTLAMKRLNRMRPLVVSRARVRGWQTVSQRMAWYSRGALTSTTSRRCTGSSALASTALSSRWRDSGGKSISPRATP